MVFKENETYEIFGYSPDTFGIRLADSLFGCVGSRLAVSVAGSVFFWSTQGPRVTSGGPSVDIAVPLDVGGPDPAGLVAESEPQDAFVDYDPQTRVVLFVWGQRVYALSIRDPNQPRWSYYELGETAQCSGLFFSTQSQAGSGGPPVGAPENLVFDKNATAHLNYTGQVSDGDTVTLDGKVYTWQTALTDVDGNVQIGVDQNASEINLFHAINLTGTPGVDYAASTVIHPTISSPSAPPNAQRLAARESGAAGNLLELSTTSAVINFTTPPDATTTLAGGVGPPGSNSIEILFENVDLLGSEDIEVHTSKDGGASYGFSGLFPATGPAGGFQTITVTKENPENNIQPVTDYKFSLRYRLGGLFSPGYTGDPDDWDTPDFDSQGEATSGSEAPVLIQRLGDNQGIFERVQQQLSRITIPVSLPSGHAALDVEVQLEVVWTDSDPDQFSGFSRGDPLETPFFQRAIWNAASPGYPTEFIDEFPKYPDATGGPRHGFINRYRMRFINGPQLGPFSNILECFAGPDPPKRNSLTSLMTRTFVGVSTSVGWENADTPVAFRICPPNPPSGHRLEIWIRNATKGRPWIRAGPPGGLPAGINLQFGNEDPFTTNAFGLLLISVGTPNDPGDEFRIALRHTTECFAPIIPFTAIDISEWTFMDATPNFHPTIYPPL